MKYKLIILLFLVPIFSVYAEGNHDYHHHLSVGFTSEITVIKHDSLLSKSQLVYICTGAYAYAYHSRPDCPGLNNCKGQINYTDEFTAVNSFNRNPCCRCWSNVSGNCKDDNTSYGGSSGSGGGGGLGLLAIAVVATSVIVLSNDIYVYPAISFYKPIKSINQLESEIKYGIGKGWLFGFRKTFKYSALEYGVSYFNYVAKYNFTNGYTNQINKSRLGGHFNYVHQIFYNRTPEWLKVYFGPSVNYVNSFGYGGMVGTEMRVFDRLRFDFRYEITSQTNQIQAGIIFTYQKKYFWQKNRKY